MSHKTLAERAREHAPYRGKQLFGFGSEHRQRMHQQRIEAELLAHEISQTDARIAELDR